jgi:hypothetical protein
MQKNVPDRTCPNRTLAAPYNAAVQLSHCGHSCMAQHFCRLKRRCADLTAVGRTCFNVRTLTILTFNILQVYVVPMNNGFPATGENQCIEDNVNGPNTPRY